MELEQKLVEAEANLEEVASLLCTTSYTLDENGSRVMDANEYIWLDAAMEILKPYYKKRKDKAREALAKINQK